MGCLPHLAVIQGIRLDVNSLLASCHGTVVGCLSISPDQCLALLHAQADADLIDFLTSH